MSKRTRSLLLKYGIGSAVALLLAAVMLIAKWSEIKTIQDQYRILSDGFTIPGLFYVFASIMMLVTNEGALNGIGFILSYTVKRLIPGRHGEQENYGRYVERKKRNQVTGYSFLFVIGGVCLALSVLFTVLFYQAY